MHPPRLSHRAVYLCQTTEKWISSGNLLKAFSEIEHVAPRWCLHPRVLSLRCRIYERATLWNALYKCADTLTLCAPRVAQGWIWKARATARMLDGTVGKARAILMPVVRRFRHDPSIGFELACYSAQLGFSLEASAWIAVVLAIADKRGMLAEWTAKVAQSKDLQSIRTGPAVCSSPLGKAWAPRKRRRSFIAATSRCLLLFFSLAMSTSHAAVQIEATAEALRAAAEAGGEILITNGGVITFSSPIFIQRQTTIASAAGVTLSGGQTSRIFEVAPAASLELINLALVDGRAAYGGAIYNDGGSLTARNCTFRQHAAIGQAGQNPGAPGQNAFGGAISSSGRLLLDGCQFENNSTAGGAGADGTASDPSQPGGNGGHSAGGAISSVGTLIISNCLFNANESAGGAGGAGALDLSSPTPRHLLQGGPAGAGIGGAISAGGACVIRSTSFSNNAALGGPGGPGGGAGGPAGGGAIAIEGGDLFLSLANFVSNRAVGAAGAGSAPFTDAESSGSGGTGGEATGSAVYVNGGKSVIDRVTVLRNSVLGGDGSSGAIAEPGVGGNGGGGGGVYGTFCNIGEMLLTASTFAENVLRGGNGGGGGRGADGGSGGKGGHAYGGGLCDMGTATVINCTIASNTCSGGAGGAGGEARPISLLQSFRSGNGGAGGNAGAAAVWTDMEEDEALIVSCTLAGNAASVGLGGAAGMVAGGITENADVGNDGEPGIFRGNNFGSMGTIRVQNTISDNASSNAQAVGMIIDLGGNLCSDGTCQFTNRSSLNNVEAGLLPLAGNGGPTPTMALRRGSRAINRAGRDQVAACDQRGFVRLPRTRRDIGAYETGARPGSMVSGWVLDGTNGLAGVTMQAGNVTTLTDATGYYELFGVNRGRQSIRPLASGWSFLPPSHRVVVRRQGVTVPSFAAEPLPSQVR